MLVLGRRKGEEIIVTTPAGERMRIVLVRADYPPRIGIDCPREWIVHRGEVQQAIERGEARGVA